MEVSGHPQVIQVHTVKPQPAEFLDAHWADVSNVALASRFAAWSMAALLCVMAGCWAATAQQVAGAISGLASIAIGMF